MLSRLAARFRHERLFSSGPVRLSSRAQALAVGGGAAAKVWTDINALAARPGMINMGQGFPDFDGSPVARRVAAEAVLGGSAALNQYSPQPGLQSLRESVSGFYERRYGVTYDPNSEIVVTAGAQEALAAAFLAFIDPGDEVLMFEPLYPFMLGAVLLAGGVPRVVTLRSPDFGIDPAELHRVVSTFPGIKAVVLNSPHNPSGRVASVNDLAAVAAVCEEHDFLAVADEVYENACFSARHMRLADVPGMRDRTVTACVVLALSRHTRCGLNSPHPHHLIQVNSGGKLFSLTGWRVGWATGPAHLLGPLGQAHTHLTFNSPSPLQAGVAAALDEEDMLEVTAPLFRENFRMLSEALLEGTSVRSICGSADSATQGGYFLVAKTPEGLSDIEFVSVLAEEKGVVCTPMSVFYQTPFSEDAPCDLVRFTVCKSREHIERACKALCRKPGQEG